MRIAFWWQDGQRPMMCYRDTYAGFAWYDWRGLDARAQQRQVEPVMAAELASVPNGVDDLTGSSRTAQPFGAGTPDPVRQSDVRQERQQAMRRRPVAGGRISGTSHESVGSCRRAIR